MGSNTMAISYSNEFNRFLGTWIPRPKFLFHFTFEIILQGCSYKLKFRISPSQVCENYCSIAHSRDFTIMKEWKEGWKLTCGFVKSYSKKVATKKVWVSAWSKLHYHPELNHEIPILHFTRPHTHPQFGVNVPFLTHLM